MAPAAGTASEDGTVVNRRARTQVQHLLRQMGRYEYGRITFDDLYQFYHVKIRELDPAFSYGLVLKCIVQARLLLPRLPQDPDRVRFDPEKVKLFLRNPLAYSMPNLTQIPAASGTNKHNKKPSLQRARLLQGIVAPHLLAFVDQKYAFKSSAPERRLVKAQSCQMPELSYCDVCAVEMPPSQRGAHNQEDRHLFLTTYKSTKHGGRGMEMQKPPRSLSGEENHITVQSFEEMEGSGTLLVNLHLSQEDWENKRSATATVYLLVCYDPPGKPNRNMYLDNAFVVVGRAPQVVLTEAGHPRQTVRNSKPVKRHVELTERSVGTYEYTLVFKFTQEDEPFRPKQPFYVMKQICVRVDNDLTLEEQATIVVEPVGKKKKGHSVDPLKSIHGLPKVVNEGEKPLRDRQELKFVKALGEYPLTALLHKLLNFGLQFNASVSKNEMITLFDHLSTLVTGLEPHNYQKYFSTLLFMEEHQIVCDMKAYGIKNVPLLKSDVPSLVRIMVPGLAESRPSVLVGDNIFVTVDLRETYLGWVHRVELESVLVSFGARFMNHKFVENMKVMVNFAFNRTSLRMEHRALDMIRDSEQQVINVAFPQEFGSYAKEHKTIASWRNRLVGENPEQAQAVRNIVRGTSLPAPYLLFGPPGTGKTVTIVEAIMQIYADPTVNNYILATAPSNSASDLLAERLLDSGVPTSQLLRLYSPSRSQANVPETLKKVCNFKGEECIFASLAELSKYRIMVCTLICSGRLVSGGFEPGHFTHIFVDECGHGMETSALVPVAGLLGLEPKPGQLVLSGDPCQLGPIVRSPVSKRLGLAESLLERLMKTCALYQKQADGTYNPLVLTKLVRNFRSHPAILKVPNELFYDGDLQPCGEHGVTHSACRWEELPQRGVPLVFHGVQGKEQRDPNSPSFYNIAEVNVVLEWTKKVIFAKFRGQKLRPQDIGIISPYRKQIETLNRGLTRAGISGVSVGSVEEFQGQERRVIIVSTVRSDPARITLDRKFRLGFLKEPKRFNVAMTRAKALLIVVGNPQLLELDRNWRRLLEHAIQLGAYKGCPFTLSDQTKTAKMRDANEDVVPVRQLLAQRLERARKAMKEEAKRAGKQNKKSATGAGGDRDLMDAVKALAFFTVSDDLDVPLTPGDPSELQQMVAPPLYYGD